MFFENPRAIGIFVLFFQFVVNRLADFSEGARPSIQCLSIPIIVPAVGEGEPSSSDSRPLRQRGSHL